MIIKITDVLIPVVSGSPHAHRGRSTWCERHCRRGFVHEFGFAFYRDITL